MAAKAAASLYRRVLPCPPAIDLASKEGKKLFAEALQGGTMEGHLELMSCFQMQSELNYCGLASLSMALNALSIDPGRNWKGRWRWFDESMLDFCKPLEKVKAEGISFEMLASLARQAGAEVEAFRTNETTIDKFRQIVKECSVSSSCHIVPSYHRATFQQTGSGHFSPIGGYHAGSDRVLILDVARFKYPPHWVPLPLLWEAMDTTVPRTGKQRGFLVISSPPEVSEETPEYLVDDVARLLKSGDVKDINKVIGTVCMALPSEFVEEFLQWAAEVCRPKASGIDQEWADEVCWPQDSGIDIGQEEENEVLRLVQETGLHKHVLNFLSSSTPTHKDFEKIVQLEQTLGGSHMLTALLLAMPCETWYGIRDEQLWLDTNELVCSENLPRLLREEVLHLQRQLECLQKPASSTTN